jgi:cytochrome b561
MRKQYDAVARWFHWTTAILVLTTIPIGIAMTEYIDGRQLRDLFFVLHESIGLSILAVTVARLGWRLLHGAPPPSKALNRIEILVSHATHVLLYAILLAMPITGYLFVVAGGHSLSYFGLFAAPRIIGRYKDLSRFAESAHLALRWVIYALVTMHIAAALHHHLVRGNDVLSRMLPLAGRSRRPPFDHDGTEPSRISVQPASGD